MTDRSKREIDHWIGSYAGLDNADDVNLTDEEARVIRKWDLGKGPLSREERATLREVASRSDS